jgi:hypothetical protein
MAELNASADPLQRYSALEQVYTEERWSAVIEQGSVLLNDLPWFSGGAPEGVKERVQLLIAHAHLYGLGQRDQAEPLYQAVISSGGEPSLIQIAEQSLQQCAAMAAAAVPEEATVTEPATPQDPIGEEAAPSPEAETKPLEPAAAESAETSGEAPAQAELPTPGQESEPEAAAEAVGTALPAAFAQTAPTNPWDADPPMADAAPKAVVDPFAAPATGAEGGAPVMPWLTAVEQETIEAQTLVIGGKAEASDPSTTSQDIPTPEQSDSANVFASLNGDSTAASAPIREERLIPDLIDEPELIEVYQADPRLSDEVVMPGEYSLAAAVAAAAAAADSATESNGIADPPEAPETEAATVLPEANPMENTPLQGFGVFRDPPKPVAKENPELLLALLRVQVG